MNWRERVRRSLPYLITAVAGFALAYLLLFFFVFKPSVLPNTGTVPDVVGMDVESARGRLENAGFELAMGSYRVDPVVARGAVAEQSPKAGAGLERGGRVIVTVSAGRPLDPTPRSRRDSAP